ncbi:hypothetical protein HK102_005973 [Quaeritorhiza haematococci]|nr:hypothetical protein HK102_005973 [Quaeritorhiza haematococci]
MISRSSRAIQAPTTVVAASCIFRASHLGIFRQLQHRPPLLTRGLASQASKEKDFYKVLGVPKTADKKAIKAKFYDLSLTYHPDLNPNNESAHAKFLEINEAYSTLSNETKRRDYDRSLSFGSDSPFDTSRTGPRRTVRRNSGINPDEWIQFRGRRANPAGGGWMGSQNVRSNDGRPIFDFEAHHEAHYGQEQRAQRRAARQYKAQYYQQMLEADKLQPRIMFGTWLTLAIFFFFYSGYVEMIFMDDEESGDTAVNSFPGQERGLHKTDIDTQKDYIVRSTAASSFYADLMNSQRPLVVRK